MNRLKLAIIDDYQSVALEMADWSVLEKSCDISVFSDHLSDVDAVVERLKPFDIVCIMRERTAFPASVLSSLPNLKLLVSNSAANAAIDMDAAEKLGIAVTHTGYLNNGTVELAWGLILSAARHLPKEIASFRSGGWQTGLGMDLAGKTLGIIGLGNLGSRVAKVGAAFEMNVIAWSQNLDPDKARAQGVTPVTKQALFEQSDIITLHMKLSERSMNLVGEAELAMMKPTAWLINTSRGPLINEAALIEALRSGSIAGAGLDVFNEEPLPPTHPFRQMENVVGTPHIGFVVEDMYRLFYGEMVDKAAAWIAQRHNG